MKSLYCTLGCINRASCTADQKIECSVDLNRGLCTWAVKKAAARRRCTPVHWPGECLLLGFSLALTHEQPSRVRLALGAILLFKKLNIGSERVFETRQTGVYIAFPIQYLKLIGEDTTLQLQMVRIKYDCFKKKCFWGLATWLFPLS